MLPGALGKDSAGIADELVFCQQEGTAGKKPFCRMGKLPDAGPALLQAPGSNPQRDSDWTPGWAPRKPEQGVSPPPPSEGAVSTCARQPLCARVAGECGSHLYIKPPVSCDAERVGGSEMDVFCQG